jgi:hypothetical protein
MIGLAWDFADLYSEHLESPKSFFYFAFLTYFGAIVSKSVTLASELGVQPRLYTVLVGESADTRKSTALSKADEFFKGLLPTELTWETLHGVGSAEGLASEINRWPGVPILLHYDELKAFVQKGRIDSSVLLPMVNTLFERGDYDNVTRRTRDCGGRVSVRDASLSLLAASTKDTYATMFTQQFTAIGFPNRLWLVADGSERRFAVPGKIPSERLQPLRERVKTLLEQVDAARERNKGRPVEYRMTPGAQRMFEEWYLSREGSIFERRLDTYGHRLALLLAVASGKVDPPEIDETIMAAVIALLRYQLEVRRECDPIDAENKIAAMEEKIRRTLARGPLKEWDLKRRVNVSRSGLWVFDTAVRNLKTASEIRVDGKKVYSLASPPASRPT